MSGITPKEWTCPNCTISVLPFYMHELPCLSDNDSLHQGDDDDNNTIDVHLQALESNATQLKIMHINTQSMVSTFDGLLTTLSQYPFDIITMSETWLKDNELLLQHVTIPGYCHTFQNRERMRGGGVGMYLKESLKFKRRKDIESSYPNLEHLWIEIPGRNRNSKLLIGTIYRSESQMNFQGWLQDFEELLSDLTISWNGMLLITGDFNIDLLKFHKPNTRRYIELLQSFNLDQMVTKATRTTNSSATLIDHIITNLPNNVTHIDLMPCPLISDHDGPYVTINVRVARYAPRYKYLRNEKHFTKSAFVEDFSKLPFQLVYAFDDPDDQISTLNSLIIECLERHAPLRRTKLTRPPAPWMKDIKIQSLQKKCKQSRYEAHKSSQNEDNWNKFRSIRNQLKKAIKKAKTAFVEKALSCKRPKDVWKTIHRILHPSPQPLRIDPDKLNKHFASTAERVVASTPLQRDLYSFAASLPQDSNLAFQFRQVTHREVLNEIKHLRSDCSTGPDNIPCKFIKLVADHLASPVTYIINNCIAKQTFPSLWKTARISPIPKVDDPRKNDDYRPISILCVLSKVYERLALRQMADFLGNNRIFNPNNNAYRRGHSTTTTMLGIRDDILRAMKRGEVTIAVLADFSKAFDTVAYQTVLSKLHGMGFSNTSLKWIISYLTERTHYVQVDDRSSDYTGVNFGVPQGSILGPILFNLYVNDLPDVLPEEIACHQYADDTTLYRHCKSSDLRQCESELQCALNNMSSWSQECNLALNPGKIKVMLFSTSQRARASLLHEYVPSLRVSGNRLERLDRTRLLGTQLHHHLVWTDEISTKISSCYKSLSVLRKLKHLAPYKVRKQLSECLVLSKLDYNDIVSYPIPEYLVKRLQRVQRAAAGFVIGRYATELDVLKLGWLPVKERRDFHLAQAIFKALYFDQWPSYLKLELYTPGRTLRSSSETKLTVPLENDTFQASAAKIFNVLPLEIRNCRVFDDFKRTVKAHYFDVANERLKRE